MRLLVFILCAVPAPLFLKGNEKTQPFYSHQFALEAGVGKVSAPGTGFPFCAYAGAWIRKDHYMLGYRMENHSDLVIFGESDIYRFKNPFIGYSWVWKNALISPQLGFGYSENKMNGTWKRGLGGEISLVLALHHRGNGAGVRIFLNSGPGITYAGIMIHLLLGWSWNESVSP